MNNNNNNNNNRSDAKLRFKGLGGRQHFDKILDLKQLHEIVRYNHFSNSDPLADRARASPGVRPLEGGVLLDHDGHLAGGTLDGILLQLIRWLQEPAGSRERLLCQDLVDQFIHAHPQVVPSEAVLDSLLTLYRAQPLALTLPDRERQRIAAQSQAAVVAVLRRWLVVAHFPHFADRRSDQPLPLEGLGHAALNSLPADDAFRDPTPLHARLAASLDALAPPHRDEIAAAMRLTDRQRAACFYRFDAPLPPCGGDLAPLPKGPVPAHMAMKGFKLRQASGAALLLQQKCAGITEHLFRLHYSLFVALSSRDLLDAQSGRYQIYKDHGERLQLFVKTSLALETRPEARVKLLALWIGVSEASLRINNLNAAIAIFLALFLKADLLAAEFNSLPKHAQAKWAALLSVLDLSKSNGRALREHFLSLLRQNLPALPYLGLFHTDVSKLLEVSPPSLQASGMINFYRLEHIGSQVSSIIRFQRAMQCYPLPSLSPDHLHVLHHLYQLPDVISDDECHLKLKAYRDSQLK